MSRVREALPEMLLLSDANHAYDLPEAVRIGHLLDELGYGWFEEPLSPEHPELYRQLQEKLRLPLAAGERRRHPHQLPTFAPTPAGLETGMGTNVVDSHLPE